LGDDPAIGEDGHEVVVAVPTRNDLHVDVLAHARPRAAALVDSDVEPFASHSSLQTAGRSPNQTKERVEIGVVQLVEPAHMSVRHYQQVTGGVRVAVEHHESALGAAHHQPLAALLRSRFADPTEDARAVFLWAGDVLHTPRRVQRIDHERR